MKARIAASIVLAVGVVLGTSACNLLAPQATTKHYDPSDGVSANVGDLAIRNVFLVSDNGETGNLVVTVVNSGDTDQQLEIQAEGTSGKITETVSVAADTTTVIGEPDGVQVVLDGLDTIPGALLPVFFTYGTEEGKQVQVPVLSGDMASYSTLVPTDAATPTQEPITTSTPVEVPTPTPTATEEAGE